MARVLIGVGEADGIAAAHLDRRPWEAMEREIDDPIGLDHDRYSDEQDDWNTRQCIALAALAVLQDRRQVDRALEVMPRADWKVRGSLRDHLLDAARPEDIPSIRRTVEAMRAEPAPAEWREKRAWLDRIHDLEEVIRRVRLRELLTTALDEPLVPPGAPFGG